MDLDVVWEDEHLLVVDKPAGVVVHPGRATGAARSCTACSRTTPPAATRSGPGSSTGSTATRPACSSSRARRRRTRGCRTLIRRRAVERRYLALVRGRPRSRTGRIEAPIGRDRVDRTRHSLDTATPRDAVTQFEVVELLGPRALLEVRLETGRTHQIRVHLEAIDLPDLAATRSTASPATSASSASSCTPPGSPSPIRSPASGSRSSRRCRPTSQRRSRAPAPPPERSYTGRVVVPPSRRPGRVGVPVSVSGSARAPPACTANNRKGANPLAVVSMRELLEAGVHFGHQTRRWNPKMKRFIFTERGGIYIIDLPQTSELLEEAHDFARNLAARGGTILFVGTKKQAQDAVSRRPAASACRTSTAGSAGC